MSGCAAGGDVLYHRVVFFHLMGRCSGFPLSRDVSASVVRLSAGTRGLMHGLLALLTILNVMMFRLL